MHAQETTRWWRGVTKAGGKPAAVCHCIRLTLSALRLSFLALLLLMSSVQSCSMVFEEFTAWVSAARLTLIAAFPPAALCCDSSAVSMAAVLVVVAMMAAGQDS